MNPHLLSALLSLVMFLLMVFRNAAFRGKRESRFIYWTGDYLYDSSRSVGSKIKISLAYNLAFFVCLEISFAVRAVW